MSDIKMSQFLMELFDYSKSIGNKPNSPFTAERFLVAVIDKITGTPANEKTPELLAVEKMLCSVIFDLSGAKDILLEHISKDGLVGYMDALYMDRKLHSAALAAEKKSGATVSAADILYVILNDPSDVIKNLLIANAQSKREGKTENKAPTSPFDKFFENSPFSSGKTGSSGSPKNEDKEASVNEPFGKTSANNVSNKSRGEMASLVADVKRIRSELGGAVFGQDNAINVFASGYFQAGMLSMVDKSRRRPKATFLFAGPPGVGKTFLAEKAAEALKLPFMRFDMSEYSDKEANIEFCGSDNVYKNGKAGNVTSFVAENPQSVLLFDEIEKAHICVIHLFLQILDAGRLRDNFTDKEVSFKDTIIIFTTNAGKQLYEDSESGNFSSISRKVIIRALQKDVDPSTGVPYFPGAICSRFASGNVVMFNHIGASFLRTIAEKEIKRHASNIEKEMGIRFDISEKVFTTLLFSEGAAVDARMIRARAEAFFNDELYELLRLVASEKAKTGIDEIENIKIDVDLTGAGKDVLALYEDACAPKVLVFADNNTVSECREKLPSLKIIGTESFTEAVEIIKSEEIGFVMLDMLCAVPKNTSSNLNIEDVDSPARDFYKFILNNRSGLPIYLVEKNDKTLSEEEKITFLRQGVRGVLNITDADGSLENKVMEISSALHQQDSMVKLARANKLVSFETSQTLSEDGSFAEIKIFDLKLSVAVDSEDSKSILSAVSRPNVKFSDVIGAGDAKKELAYFVEYLKDPKKYAGTGVKPPKGVLLYGPPGTGKTMLAKAMANESGVTFIAAEGNQFLKKYVGEGTEAVHELFKTARKYAPSILFIDEIDAIAKERRGASAASGGSEDTLTAFLTEMDGFVTDASKPVFVLAATNFDVEPGGDKSLDPALMRRFDRRVFIELPGKDDRIKFLNKKIQGNPVFDITPEQIDNIALRSVGMSLAQLDSALEMSIRSSIIEGSPEVTYEILENAFETFNNGEVKKWDASQLERVARHEAGHAFISWYNGETPSYLTVVARGNHGGYMQHAPKEGKAIYTKDEILANIRTSLGGRAAEIVYYGEKDGISTGASGDLANATSRAMSMLCYYGMDEDFGLAVVSAESLGGETAREVRESVNGILSAQMKEAVRIIAGNKDKIDALVSELMVKNYMNGAEIEQILGSNPIN